MTRVQLKKPLAHLFFVRVLMDRTTQKTFIVDPNLVQTLKSALSTRSSPESGAHGVF